MTYLERNSATTQGIVDAVNRHVFSALPDDRVAKIRMWLVDWPAELIYFVAADTIGTLLHKEAVLHQEESTPSHWDERTPWVHCDRFVLTPDGLFGIPSAHPNAEVVRRADAQYLASLLCAELNRRLDAQGVYFSFSLARTLLSHLIDFTQLMPRFLLGAERINPRGFCRPTDVWLRVMDRPPMPELLQLWQPATCGTELQTKSEPMTEPLTQAIKHNKGKTRLSLFPMRAFQLAGKVFTFGATKYAPYNWAKGLPHSELMDAALRHLTAYWEGEDNDPEWNLPHLAHALCCVAMLLESKARGIGTDDRYEYKP